MGENSLQQAIEKYISDVSEVRAHCDRCLGTARWGGSVVLMVVDAAFTSIGLNYFSAVVPKVDEFERLFVETGRITRLEDLAFAELLELQRVWKNKRSWKVAKAIATYLSSLEKKEGLGEREAFILWAKNTSLRRWRNDPIGSIRGVGINTYQYLRMMGGVDTVMPDKIVRKALLGVLKEAGLKPKAMDDLEFIEFVHETAAKTGHRPIELCWATWLHESEKELMKKEKYAEVINRI